MKTKKSILGIIVFTAIIILATVSCWSPVNDLPATKTVDIAVIEGVTVPATDGTPVTKITENAQYSGTVTWEPSHSVFASATHYTATITLTAKKGFTLQGVPADFFTVHGTTSVSNSANSGIVTAVFPSTAGTIDNPVKIEIAAIEGVTAPATGGTPVTAITENEEYSGTVTWEPDHSVFESATHYTATITLTVKEGYTLEGVPADFFSVHGTTSVNNSANSGIVTAVFPSTAGTSTDPVVIDISAIEGVTVPATGGTPVTSITENAQYSGTVTWEPNHSVFASSTHYTATITLTAKEGFTLQGVPADFFTVHGTTSASNSANSGIVTAVFPSTAGTSANPVKIEIAAIEGLTIPSNGGTPVTAITENEEYSGTVSWDPVHSSFTFATDYTATITLTPKEGYTLQGVTADFFTVAGAASVSNSANSGVITAVFQVAPCVINIPAIQGITAPAIRGLPATSITENEQYSGTVEWSPVVAKRGQVRIDLFDVYGDGWGTGALRITKNGADVTSTLRPTSGSYSYSVGLIVAEGDVVEVYWVAGPDQEENSFIMYYIDAPPSPAFTSSNNDSWNGSNALIYRLCGTMNSISGGTLLGSFTTALPPGLFTSATQYTATITLTPKTGYTLEGVSADFFTVAGATSANNSANSGVITAPFPRTNYALGDTGPGGGKIFYYSEAGFTMTDTGEVCHYFEAAPNNMSTTLAWASSDYTNTSIPDAVYGNGSPIGAGRKNTAAILAIDADAPAAKACAEYNGLGLTDWFLPSRDELAAMYTNMSYIGNMAGTQNYWSSTEFAYGASSAHAQNFNANVTSTQGKSNALLVRAIRAF